MKKTILFSFFVLFFLVSGFAQQQSDGCQAPTYISLVRFNTGTYVQGGHVAIFIEPEGIFELDNQFILELSDETGSFVSATTLATEQEFFLPAMNGVLPSDAVPGASYKLRVRTTNPVTTVETDTFEIVADGSPDVLPAQLGFLGNTFTDLDTFIKCIDLASGNYFFGYKDKGQTDLTPSENGGIRLMLVDGNSNDTTIRIFHSGSWQEISVNFFGQFEIPSGLPVGYYLMEFDRSINTGTSSEYHNISGFIFHFNTNITGIANTSSETVCVDDSVGFEVPVSSLQGNYPGSLYSIHYGDMNLDSSSQEYYTHDRLLNCNTLSHTYDTTTCISEFQDENPDNGNFYFKLNFNLYNKGLFNNVENSYDCEEYVQNGGGTSKWINVSLKPSASFVTEEIICEGSPIEVTDTSIEGSYGFGSECSTEYVTYWEVLGPGDSSWSSIDPNNSFFAGWVDFQAGTLTIPGNFTQGKPGCWKVRLIINNPVGCVQSDTYEETIIVEPEPSASFAFTPSEFICAPETISFQNTSNTESVTPISCGNPTYTWMVTPDLSTPATADGFSILDQDPDDGIAAQNQTDINISFDQPGAYTVSLKLENVCGTNVYEDRIIILGDPSVSFNTDNKEVCQESPANHTLDFGDLEIVPTYTESPYTPTSYLWEVFENDGTTPATNYTFVNATDSGSDFPQINFTSFGEYIVRVTVSGYCDVNSSDDFSFIFKQVPVITNDTLSQTICSEDSTSPISLVSDIPGTTYQWQASTSDAITGFPADLQNTATIPSMQLFNGCNTTGKVTVQVTPTFNGCVGDPVDFEFIVAPKPTISDLTTAICSGESFLLEPENDCANNQIVPNGTTYDWTILSQGTGLNGISGSGVQISGTLTNITSQVQSVIYEVFPTAAGCSGDPFTVTVTVYPEP
ncbi:PKD-like domain-containing protein, partial [Flagellimonas marinaquae]|uniref:PKD-like domain-containing protein n=1 Tax=Flagellimonas marinaquae TaxID=254955 RepID=UPI0028BD5B4B